MPTKGEYAVLYLFAALSDAGRAAMGGCSNCKRLRWLMQEAFDDFHGKAVLFSSLYINALEEVNDAN